jgi:hypothetical protein
MRFLKVTGDGSGGSRFEDVEVAQAETPYTDNTPPLLVSPATAASGFAFVNLPPDASSPDRRCWWKTLRDEDT